MIHYVYDSAYLRWQLGEGHPTDPVRAKYALRMMKALNVPYTVTSPRYASVDELTTVHTTGYVQRTAYGRNSEWDGVQPVLGDIARLMAGGTMTGVDLILRGDDDGRVMRVFNPQGAKHHAMHNTGSGFCVYNDMAIAAHRFQRAGMKVAYLDWDFHHGDGVQALTDGIGGIRTWSVFGHGFAEPTTLMLDPEGQHVHAVMEQGTGNSAWLDVIDTFCDGIEDFEPDVILLATGADAHMTDPLGNFRVTVEGYSVAGQMVNDLAHALDVPVLIGGAGGYQPTTWTPMCWAVVANALAQV